MMRLRATFLAHAAVVLLFTVVVLALFSSAQIAATGGPVHPELSFSSYLLGPSDRINAVAAASDGSLYVAGVTLAQAGALDASRISAGEGKAFAAKFSPDGSKLLYFTYLSNSGLDEARAIAVDVAGNAYVAGTTRATDFAVVHALQPACKLDGAAACEGTAFVAKVDVAGDVVFATYLGGSGGDEANAIAIDARGNMFVAGSTRSLDFPVSNPMQRFAGGNGDAFVAGISASGSRVLFATYLGGSDTDEARALALDAAGNLYIVGKTSSVDFPVGSPLQSQCLVSAQGHCQGSAFVTKLSANGKRILYSTYLGGSGGDAANAIAVDGQSQAYVAGVTRSTDFPTTRTRQTQLRGRSNAFLSKLSEQGSALAFSTYLGGSGADQANAVVLDRSGNVMVAGSTYSPDFPVQSALQSACGRGKNGGCSFDAFLAAFTPDGSQLRFSTYLGGSGSDLLRSLSVDPQGSAYLGGWTTSRDFPQAQSPQTPTGIAASASSRKGGSFVAKVSGLGSPQGSVSCGAGTNNWTGGAGDNQWGTAANWSTKAVPVSTDNVCVASSFTTTINVSGLAAANQTIASLTAGDTLNFNGGPLTITGNATLSADLAMVGGSLVFSGTTSMTTMHQSGGVVSGAGTITLSGLLTWFDGAICTVYTNGGCPAGTNAVVNINGGMNVTGTLLALQARTLNNPSGQTVTYTEGAALPLYAGAVVNNSGTWDLTNDGSIFQSGNNDTFNNKGTLRKTSGTGNSYIDPTFNNSGAVLDNGGLTMLFRGTFAQTAGTTELSNGAALQFTNGTATFSGGTFTGNGKVTGNLSNTGANFQGGTDTTTGVITDTGTYNQAATGIFTAKISGSGCTTNDEFTFTGAATLGGPLEIATVNGCVPTAGAQFTLMTFASKTGTFSSVTEGWSVTYNTTSVVVKYTAGTPGVTFSPNPLAFGAQVIGTSVVKKVTVKNSGTDGVYIYSVAVTSSYTQANTCVGIVVNPGSSCTISVTFTPTVENSIPGTLTINDNSGTGSQSVPLTGSGTYLQVTPASAAFPAQLLNTSSSPLKITLKNTNSAATLTISSITLSGANAADFSENKACDSVVLAAGGGTCSFTVTFTPSALGKRTASLKIAENGGASPISVALSGSGTYVTLSPSPLAFGSVTVGTSLALPVTLTNNNPSAAVAVSAATMSGADAKDYTTQLGASCSSVPANGGTCTITVTFKPSAKGARPALMTVTDNDSGSPQVDNVSGTGQ